MPAKGMRLLGTAFCGSAMKVASACGVQVMPLRFIAGRIAEVVEAAGLAAEHGVEARADAVDALLEGVAGRAFVEALLAARSIAVGARHARCREQQRDTPSSRQPARPSILLTDTTLMPTPAGRGS